MNNLMVTRIKSWSRRWYYGLAVGVLFASAGVLLASDGSNRYRLASARAADEYGDDDDLEDYYEDIQDDWEDRRWRSRDRYSYSHRYPRTYTYRENTYYTPRYTYRRYYTPPRNYTYRSYSSGQPYYRSYRYSDSYPSYSYRETVRTYPSRTYRYYSTDWDKWDDIENDDYWSRSSSSTARVYTYYSSDDDDDD